MHMFVSLNPETGVTTGVMQLLQRNYGHAGVFCNIITTLVGLR